MNQNIHELTKALRDAAKAIEDASLFKIGENLDLTSAVSIIQAHRNPNNEVTLTIAIDIPQKKNGEPEVTYRISEGYKNESEAGRLKECLEIFISKKVAKDTLTGLAKIAGVQDVATESDAL